MPAPAPLWFRCLASFAFALVADVVAAAHLKTLVANEAGWAMATVFGLQFINNYGCALFVDDKRAPARLAVTAAGALAAALGTMLVILCSH